MKKRLDTLCSSVLSQYVVLFAECYSCFIFWKTSIAQLLIIWAVGFEHWNSHLKKAKLNIVKIFKKKNISFPSYRSSKNQYGHYQHHKACQIRNFHLSWPACKPVVIWFLPPLPHACLGIMWINFKVGLFC